MIINDPLPPPQPMDKAGTRPAFSLSHLRNQILGIQIYCAMERIRKNEPEAGK